MKIDEHGIPEKNPWMLLFTYTCMIILLTTGLARLLVIFEVDNANITTYGDALWVLFMSMSTIGFGDYYPVSSAGRVIIVVMLIAGGILLGFIVNTISGMVRKDNSIKNRELKTQLAEVLRKLEHFEEHLGVDTSISKDSHLLDIVLHQSKYESNNLRDGFITAGVDSSGMYILSIEAYVRENGSSYKRWFPYSTDIELINSMETYIKRSDVF
jgi:hypothetical protein